MNKFLLFIIVFSSFSIELLLAQSDNNKQDAPSDSAKPVLTNAAKIQIID